jgi:hypothetical protein
MTDSMKKTLFQLLIVTLFFTLFACSGDEIGDTHIPPEIEDDEDKEDNDDLFMYEWEKNRDVPSPYNDMVLIYSGGSHRKYRWDEMLLKPYVTYTDRSGKEFWMFDSFLFLEIKTGDGRSFASGYADGAANQQDWKNLVDHYFQPDSCLGALNKSIASAKARLGEPMEKHKVLIGVPQPIQYQVDWGSVKDNVKLDFSNLNDRIAACKWYIDYARKKFDESNFKNIELAGFYWVHEAAYGGTREIAPALSSYLNDLNYSFIWIPYNNAPGAFDWKQMNFNHVYYQPNYFFDDTKPLSVLHKACEDAIKYGMDMEIEFDNRALTQSGGWGYRLEDYLNAFKEYGISTNNRIAYYQGGTTLYSLSRAVVQEDEQLYHKFCKFVTERSQ